jgi:hypothetical protein
MDAAANHLEACQEAKYYLIFLYPIPESRCRAESWTSTLHTWLNSTTAENS